MSPTSATTDPTSALSPAESTREVARANLCLLMSRAFSSPESMEASCPDQLRHLAGELPDALQYAALSLGHAWEKALDDSESMALAYARLFLGPFRVLAPPYASFYLEVDQRLMGEVTQATAQAYTNAGLQPGPGPREAADHVALEWEFMYYLTHQYITTGEEQWPEVRRTFRSTHMVKWMPNLADAIEHAAEHPFYDALAVFLRAVLDEPVYR